MKKINIFASIICLFAICSFYLGITDDKSITPSVANTNNIVETSDTFKSNKNYEKDIVAYIYFPNTDFETEIVQTKDNSYYLNHDINGKKIDKGMPFLDYRDIIGESKVLRIYGHNSNTIYTEFNFLEKYYGEEYFKKNRYFYLETENELRKYEVFSAYVEISDWSYYQVNFNIPGLYQEELNKYKDNSWYDTKVDVNEEDEILILQTCSYLPKYKNYEHKFFLLMGKRIE